jgi:hypothetical protein
MDDKLAPDSPVDSGPPFESTAGIGRRVTCLVAWAVGLNIVLFILSVTMLGSWESGSAATLILFGQCALVSVLLTLMIASLRPLISLEGRLGRGVCVVALLSPILDRSYFWILAWALLIALADRVFRGQWLRRLAFVYAVSTILFTVYLANRVGSARFSKNMGLMLRGALVGAVIPLLFVPPVDLGAQDPGIRGLKALLEKHYG